MVKISTKKILGLELAVVFALLLASWLATNVVRSYVQVAILTGAILIGVALLGWARVPKLGHKWLTRAVILAVVLYQVLIFVLLGWRLGFVRNVYHVNLVSFWRLFLPMIAMIVTAEIWRGQMLLKGHNSRAVIVMTTVALIGASVIWAWPNYQLGDARAWFDLAVTVCLPSVLTNILFSVIAYYHDYRVNIAYRLIMELPIYVLPIYPAASQYLNVLLQTFLVTILIGVVLLNHWRQGVVSEQGPARQGQRQKRVLNDRQQRMRKTVYYAAGTLVAMSLVVYAGLMSGLFKYYFLAIGSGSMMPKIARGDMVLVEKSQNYDELEEGDILVYKHSDATVVHRIVEVREELGQWSFVTKGDANDSADNWVVLEADVIGTVKARVAGMGFPTLWLSEPFR